MSNPIFFRQGIRLPGIPIGALDAATKGYVDDLISSHTHTIEQVDGLAAALANATTGLTLGTAYQDAFSSASEYYPASTPIDLDTVGRGRKILASSQALTNGPPHSDITFWHIETRTIYGADDTRLVQIATSYNGPHVIYTRRLFGDVWSAWIRILDSNMTVNDIAGTLSIANGGTGGSTQATALTNLGAASVADAWGRGQTGPTLVSFSGDLNDCSGFHALYAGTNATNRPSTNAAIIGFGTTDYTQQMAMRNGIFNIRSQENGVWGAWDRVVTQDGNHTFTGVNNYGVVRSFNGTAGVQTILRSMGWSNQIVRWADVIESNGSYSLFSYNASGAGAKSILNVSTTAAGGTDKLTVGGLMETRNITVSGTSDCSIACVPTSGRAVRFAATSSGNSGFYDQTNSKWLLQINAADLVTLAGSLTVNGGSNLIGNIIVTGNTTMSGYGYVNGGRIYGSTELNLVGGSSTSVIRIRPQGWTSTGQTQFNSNGTVTFTGALTAPDYILSSDIRLKSDIVPLENRGRIEPISYDMDGRRELGVSAQQVRQHWPEAVTEKDDGYLAVAYDRLIPVLAEQGNRLEDEVLSLKEQNAALAERLLLLEAVVLGRMR